MIGNFHNVNNINAVAQQRMQHNRIRVGVRNWQNATVQDLLNFISRNTRISIMEPNVEGNVMTGYVLSQNDADALLKWNGVRFAGNNLKFEVLGLNGTEGTSTTVTLLRNFLYRRYDPQSKMLNLGSLRTDPELLQKGLFSSMSTQSKMFPALMKIASKETQLVVESVNLADNNLKDISSVTTLAQTFPSLKNLCLANNQISRFSTLESWKNKFKELRELLMTNNPIANDKLYRTEMLRLFPKLVILDNVIVRDAQKLDSIFSLPMKLQPFFFENDELGRSATEFVTNFLNLWDGDRTQLLGLYTPQSQFSVSVDSSVPPSTVRDSDQNPAFGLYLSLSRNITKISTEKSVQQRLSVGPEAISNLFKSLPKTRHHLQDDPSGYSMQSVTYGQVNGYTITLHGYFEETEKPEIDVNSKKNSHNRPRRFNHGHNASNNRLSKKSFDRTWVIVPMQNFVVIASDLLTIRPYTYAAWIPKEQPFVAAPNSAPNPTPVTQAPANGATLIGGPSPTPTQLAPTLQLPPDVQSLLNPVQLELLNRIHTETKLNAEYSYMLAEQSGWNYDNAIKGFQSSINNIPREAYVQ